MTIGPDDLLAASVAYPRCQWCSSERRPRLPVGIFAVPDGPILWCLRCDEPECRLSGCTCPRRHRDEPAYPQDNTHPVDNS